MTDTSRDQPAPCGSLVMLTSAAQVYAPGGRSQVIPIRTVAIHVLATEERLEDPGWPASQIRDEVMLTERGLVISRFGKRSYDALSKLFKLL